MSGKTVLILGSYAPSLVHFRGALIAAMVERGHPRLRFPPSCRTAQGDGAEPREFPLVSASLNSPAMLRSLREVRWHQHRLLRPGRSRANPDAQRKIGPGDVGGGKRSALPDHGRSAGMLALFPAVPSRSADQPDQQLQLRLQVDSARNEPGCARSAGRRRTRLSHGVSS
jgi:hypothetical protein